MKKKIISCVMLMMMLMCVTEVSAQWSVTPEAGMNVTKYKNSPAAVGFKAGAAVSYTFGSGLFSLQSGLYYVQRGTGKSFFGTAYGKGVDRRKGAGPLSLFRSGVFGLRRLRRLGILRRLFRLRHLSEWYQWIFSAGYADRRYPFVGKQLP